MDMENIRQRAWRAWASAGLLAVLCAVMAVLQSRWIGEVTMADRDRLREQLEAGLNRLSADLNDRVAAACAGLMPDSAQFEQAARETVYANQYRRWKETHEPFFRRIALVIPTDGNLNLSTVDLDSALVTSANWPPEWSGMRDALNAHLSGEPARQLTPRESALIELPHFGPAIDEFGGPGLQEEDWIIVELNLDYIRGTVIPELLFRYHGKDYDAE